MYLKRYRSCTDFSKPKPKRRHLGQGQGHRDQNFDVHGKVLSKGMCLPNIKGMQQKLQENDDFSKSEFRNLNTDSGVKVKVTGVKILT